MLDSHFDPKTNEPDIYKRWEAADAFAPREDAPGKPFSIVIPPPNVTGVLHIGHALNNTLQDILVRYHRMCGRKTLWQPGVDHAGIATQMTVERQLAKEGNTDRRSMGREAFIKRVWQWKEESGGQIVGQLKRLGASCDWSRERFTLDEGLSEAVRKVFVQLYEEGLIYRDKRLVNWDPHFQTALSDLEVENREVDGHFWHFAYPLEDGSGEIQIATTRPETMLGDGAVAVHPSDERYKDMVGKKVWLPLADRLIPIIADEYPDPEFGSGAVKITGAHDFNDFEVARRHNIPMFVIMDAQGRMCDPVPEVYRGLDRFEARKRIVADIDKKGLLRGIEDKVINQPFGDRSGVVVEPRLTDQWYVDAKTLAGPAIEAVEQGKTRFVPENWSKTYYEWMRNIEPWCISRQLWWGHRIPAWYGPDETIFVAETENAAHEKAQNHYGKPVELSQDEDVLDTWFSSGLWPFSTMGWPEDTPELKTFYPTTTLVTAFDIIFFWVARMMMQGLHFMKQVPFETVYIHALVRDEHGKKMSKSVGNVIDPLELIDEYGADALRFTLAAMAAQGRDVKLAKSRIAGYRNFGTKLWNAARFCEMNGCLPKADANFSLEQVEHPTNRWIISEAILASQKIASNIESYRFNDAAGAAYSFVWHIFCDWHVELIKPILNSDDAALIEETRQTTGWVLQQILKCLHPFMPFITEALWDKLGMGDGDKLLISEGWPDVSEGLINEPARAQMNWVIGLISEIRQLRGDLNIPPAAKPPLSLISLGQIEQGYLERHVPLILRLARLEQITLTAHAPAQSVQSVFEGTSLALSLEGVLDFEAEQARLMKDIKKHTEIIEKIDKKLDNQQFLSKAPPAVITEQKRRQAEAGEALVKLETALDVLKSALN